MDLIISARVARLATVDETLRPHVIPVVFVFNKNSFFIPLDKKKKRVNPRKLRRIKNIKENPNTTLLIDYYHENWGKLFFLMIHGKASIVEFKDKKKMDKVHKLLISKYSQYNKVGISDLCIKIRPQKFTYWENAE